MRAVSDLPPRPRRTQGRGRAALVVAAVVAFVLITSLRGIAGFYTDFLWFDSLGLSSVWRGVLGAKATLALIFTATFFALMWVSLFIADRLAPPFRPAGPEEELVERYHEVIRGRTGLVRVGVSLLLAAIAGAGQSAEWEKWILFINGGSFGVKDDQFDTDIGFYVFKLPFLSFLTSWLFAALIIVFIVTAIAHYLNGGIRVQTARERVTPQVKAHLSVLLGLLALVKAAGYVLQRYELTVSTRGAVDGATYTDVKAQLPAINLLLLISIAAFVLFIVNIFRRGWVLPVLGVGLWALVAVIAGGIYPQFVQRFQVKPSELSKEAPYIARNIAATREAIGLADVDVRSYVPNQDPEKVDLAANADTVRNIRLWDPSAQIAGKTFQELQRVRQFYRLNDIDIDRYEIDGEPTEVMISARDLDSSRVPASSWESKHLAFTHGYGLAMAPTNANSSDGQPEFVIENVPITNRAAEDIELKKPGIYFGEKLGGYVVVGTGRDEVDFQDDKGTQPTTYDGSDGVEVGSLLRKLAFALRFGDINPVLSSYIDGDSKILYIRDIRERAEALAPFLHFDADPYPVVVDGGIQWVLDAYTTTDRYPYAQRAETDGLDSASGLDHGFNYVRNSVKAVVDAYEGTVTYYVMPVDDPIIEAYRKAFPKLFTDASEMPAELIEHLRYPEDLFRVQTNVWGRYHIDDVNDFYTNNDAWNVAQDPGTASAPTATSSTNAQGEAVAARRSRRIDPYYLLTRLPGEQEAEFIILRPFVPQAEDDKGQLLTSFLVARSDGDSYGKLASYVMPRDDLPLGPALIGGNISGDDAVSREESLLSGTGSTLLKGNLILVPIEDSLLYVRPYFVEATQTKIPKLERVIAVFGDRVVIKQTLAEVLEELFGASPPTLEEPSGGEDPVAEEPTGTVNEQVARLLSDAARLYAEADAAFAARDLGTYQEKNDQARAKVEQAAKLLEGEAAGGGGSPPSTTTTEPASA